MTEERALQLALDRQELRQAARGAQEVELGRSEREAQWPNPELSYTREQTFGSLGTREDYLVLSQSVDLSGRRALRSEAARARAQSARSRGEGSRAAFVAQVRRRFFAAVYRSERLDAVQAWGGRIGQALGVVARRERGGYAAAYDRLRLEREQTLALAQLEQARAADEQARHALQALIGSPVPARVEGALRPPEPAPSLATLQARLEERPDLRALNLQLRAAMLEQRAAARWWVPDLKLELGWKGADQGAAGRADGFVLGASLSLPLWNESKGTGRIARGRAQVATAQRKLEFGVAQGELAGVRAEFVRLQKAAVSFRAKSLRQGTRLVAMAEKGYAAGELGLLELLDAYRGATEDSLTALDLDWAARQSEIRLQRLVGEAKR